MLSKKLVWLLLFSVVNLSETTYATSSAPAVKISLASEPETLVAARSLPCGIQDFYPDNPARALVDANNKVHVFANNSGGYYQLLGDSLNGPLTADCSPLITSVTAGQNQDVTKYKNYVWIMSSWIDKNGKMTALIHDEFHGEKFGKPSAYCSVAKNAWKLPECQYWNIVAAVSADDGKTFQWVTDNTGAAKAVITSPYQYDVNNTNLQGMPAQTNIVQDPNDQTSYYLFVENYEQPGNNSGVCLFRSKDPSDVTAWRGWDGTGFTIAMNQNPYHSHIKTPSVCKNIPSLPQGFSVNSLSYHEPSKQYILVGTKPSAFIYFTSPDLIHWSAPGTIMAINWWNKWFPNCTVTGEAYPSLLDPNTQRSNFDYSSATPYLYYTRLNANQDGCSVNNNVNDRDLVRVKLNIQYTQATNISTPLAYK